MNTTDVNALLKCLIVEVKILVKATQLPDFSHKQPRWFYSFFIYLFLQVSSTHTSHLENSWLSPIRRKWRLTFGATEGHIYYEWRGREGGGGDPLRSCRAWIYNSKRERPLRHSVYDSSIWYWCTLKCKQAQKAGGMQCCSHHLPVCCWGGKVVY